MRLFERDPCFGVRVHVTRQLGGVRFSGVDDASRRFYVRYICRANKPKNETRYGYRRKRSVGTRGVLLTFDFQFQSRPARGYGSGARQRSYPAIVRRALVVAGIAIRDDRLDAHLVRVGHDRRGGRLLGRLICRRTGRRRARKLLRLLLIFGLRGRTDSGYINATN